MLLVWLLVAVCLSTFVVETAFMQVMSAKRALALGIELPLDMKCVSYFWLVVGVPADMVFNWLRGSWIFREWPRWGEWMFTARVQRHVDESEGWRLERALRWARILNAIDPQPHIIDRVSL